MGSIWCIFSLKNSRLLLRFPLSPVVALQVHHSAHMSQLGSRSYSGDSVDWWITTSHLTRMSRFGWEEKPKEREADGKTETSALSPLFLVSANINLSFIIDERPMNSSAFHLSDVRRLCPGADIIECRQFCLKMKWGNCITTRFPLCAKTRLERFVTVKAFLHRCGHISFRHFAHFQMLVSVPNVHCYFVNETVSINLA